MSCAVLEQQGPMWRIRGELDFESVAALWAHTEPLFEKTPPTQIDLADSRANSAGVALLVEWKMRAQQKGHDLAFVNIPPQIRALMQMTGVESLLTKDH